MSDEIKVFEFEGAKLLRLTYKGRQCLIAAQLGKAMGYADGGRLVDSVREHWRDEFNEGEHFAMIEGQELQDLQAVAADSPDFGESGLSDRPRSLMVLFREGAYLACLLTKKPVGKRLRAKVSKEILPAIADTGTYTAPVPAQPSSALVQMPALTLQSLHLITGQMLQQQEHVQQLAQVQASQGAQVSTLQQDLQEVKRTVAETREAVRKAEVPPAEARARLVAHIERNAQAKTTAGFRDAWRAFYREVEVRFHVDLRRRAENARAEGRTKVGALDIAGELKLLPAMLKLAQEMFPEAQAA